MKMEMPQQVKNFLDGLSTSDAENVWTWLDGDPDAINKMIETLCECHLDMPGLDN